MAIHVLPTQSKNSFTQTERECLRFLQMHLHTRNIAGLKTSATTEQRIQYLMAQGALTEEHAKRARYCSRVIARWLCGHSKYFIRFINRHLGGIIFQKNLRKDNSEEETKSYESTEDYLSRIILDSLSILYNYDLDNAPAAPLSYIGTTLALRSADYIKLCAKSQAYEEMGIIARTSDEGQPVEEKDQQELKESECLQTLWEIIRERYQTSTRDARSLAVKFGAPSMRRNLTTKGTPVHLKVASWVALIIGFEASFSLALQHSPLSQETSSSLAYLTLLRLPLNSA